jgi:hypothetical protein
MSNKAIKKLNSEHKNYSLNTEMAGDTTKNPAGGHVTVKAFIQIFDPKYEPGKNPTIVKAVNAYGVGADLKTAQDDAIEQAVEKLGL